MKSTTTLFLGLFFVAQTFAQTTLRNLNEGAPLIDWMLTGTTQGVPEWGSLLGHNIYGDEAFGEKYLNTGATQVFGIVAHHGGRASGSNNEAWYRIHSVAANGLPGPAIGGKKIKLADIDRSGEAFVVMFDAPVNVNGDFFVIWDVMDYSHGTQNGDTLRLLAGEEGSRPASDHVHFGRNVVRWHSHGATPAWKDFLTQNFSPFSIYFGIYPIVNQALSIDEPASQTELHFFPQPCNDQLQIRFEAPKTGTYTFELFGLDGRLLHREERALDKAAHELQLDASRLSKGSFVAVVRSGSFQIARMLQKM